MSDRIKKIIALTLALLMTAGLAACARGNAGEPDAPVDPGPSDPGPSDPGPSDPGPSDSGPSEAGPSKPESDDNLRTLISAFEASLEKLSTLETPIGSLPESYTASGTLTYIGDDDVKGSPTPFTFARGSDFLSFSAPELLGDRVYYLDTGGIEQLKGAVEPYLEELDLVPLPDGSGFTATVPADKAAGLLSDGLLSMRAIPFLYAAISGDLRGLDPESAIRAAVDKDVSVTFTLSDGMLTGVEFTGPINGSVAPGDEGLTIVFDGLGELTVSLNEGLSAAGRLSYGDGTNLSLDLGYAGGLSYIHYSTDVTGLGVEGDYSFGNLTFSGYAFTGNRGDRTQIDLTISLDSSLPEDAVPLTSLSAQELADIWSKLNQGDGR